MNYWDTALTTVLIIKLNSEIRFFTVRRRVRVTGSIYEHNSTALAVITARAHQVQKLV